MPEFGLKNRRDLVPSAWRHRIVALAQDLHIFRRKDVGPRAYHLRQLDHQSAQRDGVAIDHPGVAFMLRRKITLVRIGAPHFVEDAWKLVARIDARSHDRSAGRAIDALDRMHSLSWLRAQNRWPVA